MDRNSRWLALSWRLLIHGVLSCIVLGWVLSAESLLPRSLFPFLPFLLGHSVLIGSLLEPSSRASDSPRLCWRDELIVAVGSILLVWGPSALAVLAGFRSHYQYLAANPWYPYVAERDFAFVWLSLVSYLILVPTIFYALRRGSHPSPGFASGYGIAVGIVASWAWFIGVHQQLSRVSIGVPWPTIAIAGALLSAAILLLLTTRSLSHPAPTEEVLV